MENFVGITSYLRREILAEGGDPSRETLSLVRTREGADLSPTPTAECGG